jgi:hypothetical protein
MLNKAPRNTDYDTIKENSSDDEKLDVLFRLMSKETYFNYVHYNKLFISYAQEALFNAKIEDTGFVESQQPAGSQIMYRLKNKARLTLDKYDNSYLKYLEATKEY